MSLAILGWGTALPEHSLAQSEAATLAVRLNGLTAEQARLVPVLYRRCGVRRRASVLLREAVGGGQTQSFFPLAADGDDRGPSTAERMRCYARASLPLAERAARRALAAAELAPAAVTHLVTVSCSGFFAPGPDVELIRRLDLPPTTQRTHVGFMGCHGALNGLRVARGLGAAEPGACILLCAIELCSLHYQYGWDPEQVVANALFADGAAALVAASAPSASLDDWRVAASGSCLLPDCAEAMTWTIGDHGFRMTLSPRVPDLIGAHLRPWLSAWLAGQNLSLDQVASWAIHPGGPRILQAVEAALDLPPAATAVSRAVLAECGNMSSPTILFILERLARARAPRPCVALGFGPGLVAEAVLFR